jgi:HD-GYP domain-containing protein (c-di-GMP phosphodiesterase class II)
MSDPTGSRLRLAEFLGGLSLVTDLGMGHPPEEAIRGCLLATRLAGELGIHQPELADVYYTALLRYLGCHGSAHEEGAAFAGDDLGMRQAGVVTDFYDPRDIFAFLVTRVGKGKPAPQRIGMIARAAASGKRIGDTISKSFCEVGASTARRLGLPTTVQDSLFHIFERWDGKGPHRVKGDAVPLPARIASLSALAVVLNRVGGAQVAVEIIGRRAGKALDPEVARVFARDSADLLNGPADEDAWRSFLEEEPEPVLRLDERRLDDAARAFADLVDLKSPFFHGHSQGVAELAEAAARALSLDDGGIVLLRRASLLHDLGRAGIRNGIWEKSGPLSMSEWEQVRLHAYQSERILARSSALAPLAAIAGMHHERLDGSGYHRQATAAATPRAARILAAADAFHAMTEERSYRPPLPAATAAAQLTEAVRAQRFDAEVVAALLDVAGQHRHSTRHAWPADLTDREVDVLRLVARGLSNKQVAGELVVSEHTVRHHTLHIYSKVGVSTRGAAALFAMEHGLLAH